MHHSSSCTRHKVATAGTTAVNGFSWYLALNIRMAESIKIENVQDRLDCLQELTDFTEKCRKRLNDIFDTLGWSWTYEDANKVS